MWSRNILGTHTGTLSILTTMHRYIQFNVLVKYLFYRFHGIYLYIIRTTVRMCALNIPIRARVVCGRSKLIVLNIQYIVIRKCIVPRDELRTMKSPQ